MENHVRLTINGIPVTAVAGTTIHKAAQAADIAIPTLCYHDYCTANGLCRICVVEVGGARTLLPACVAVVAEGMQVFTQSERVRRSRRTILEMLQASVDLSDAPEILEMIEEYKVDRERFPEAVLRDPPVIDDNPMYVRDYAKCILCWRCVQVCASDAQYTYAINFEKRGFETRIATFFQRAMPLTTCVFCGQCVGVCPTGALKSRRAWLLERGLPLDEVQPDSFA
jgi:NADH dehydrogenase/NADH:ubiquinone oxidoreductase subunit G